MADPVALVKLKAFLHEHNERPSAFAARAGIQSSTFFHILSGRRTPGRDSSLAIDSATGGAVPAPLWSQKKPERRKRKAA